MTLDEKTAEVTEALLPVIQNMVKAEAARIAARPPSVQVKMDRIEAEIMKASADVAAAVDQLRQAQFAGGPEIPARRKLEQAADRLHRVMTKHGRVRSGPPCGPEANELASGATNARSHSGGQEQ